MIGPISIGTPTMPITRPMRCGPAAWDRIVMPAGMIMPPPRPCRTRKHDQRLGRPRHARQRRAGEEEADRDDVQALGAEAVCRPAGERDHGGEREHVARRDPLDRGQGRVEVLGQGVDRDVDDRRVEDRHERADHDDGRDADQRAVKDLLARWRVLGRRRGRSCGVLGAWGRAVGAGGVLEEERGQCGAEGRALLGVKALDDTRQALQARGGDAGDGVRSHSGQRQALDAPVAVVVAPRDHARRGPWRRPRGRRPRGRGRRTARPLTA